MAPGLKVMPSGDGRTSVIADSRSASNGCVNYYVDGFPFTSMTPGRHRRLRAAGRDRGGGGVSRVQHAAAVHDGRAEQLRDDRGVDDRQGATVDEQE